jgi:two-component system CheB/CheR fusion protein
MLGRQGRSPDKFGSCMQNTAVATSKSPFSGWFSRSFIEALPTGIYVCDTDSVLIAYNSRAADIWGPAAMVSGTRQRHCGGFKLYLSDGRFVPHDEMPMALVPITRQPSGAFEAIIEREDGSRREVVASVTPLFDDDGSYIGFLNSVQDVTERKDTERREAAVRDALAVAKRNLRKNDRTLSELGRLNDGLVESEGFLQGILDSVSDCIEVLDAEGRIQFMNRDGLRAMEIDDFDQVRGANWAEEQCGDQIEAAKAAIAVAKAGGVGRFETCAPTLKGKALWWDVAVTPIADGITSKGMLLAISRDISEKKAGEEARKLLGQELQHRLKNTIAMVQSIANQTLRHAGSVDEARTVLSNRIAMLGKAHDILLNENGTGADLVGIVGAMIELHADRRERFVVRGPNVNFGPKAAMAMALALHELATNAHKYGALSNDCGEVHVHWELVGADRLKFIWAEQRGPQVTEPIAKGFGSRLTQSMLISSIGGNPQARYDPEGFTFKVDADLRVIQKDFV